MEASANKSSAVLASSDILLIFFCVGEVCDLHKHFMEKLSKKLEEDSSGRVQIADVFAYLVGTLWFKSRFIANSNSSFIILNFIICVLFGYFGLFYFYFHCLFKSKFIIDCAG